MAGPIFMLLAGGADTPAFDPITGVGWAHAYWTEGTEFVASGPSNNTGKQTWPDEIGTADFSQATSGQRPVYKTAGLSSGFKCLVFTAASSQYYPPVAYTTINPTRTLVVIGHTFTNAGDVYVTDGFDASHRCIVGYRQSGTTWQHNYGVQAVGGSASAVLTAMRSKIVSGTSDVLTVNGSTVATGSAGDNAMTGLTIGSAYDGGGAFLNGELFFVGVYAGDVTSDSGWTSFVSWASSKYGATIS